MTFTRYKLQGLNINIDLLIRGTLIRWPLFYFSLHGSTKLACVSSLLAHVIKVNGHVNDYWLINSWACAVCKEVGWKRHIGLHEVSKSASHKELRLNFWLIDHWISPNKRKLVMRVKKKYCVLTIVVSKFSN